MEKLDWEVFPEWIYELTPAMHLTLGEMLQPPRPLHDGGDWLATRLLNLLQSRTCLLAIHYLGSFIEIEFR